MSLASAWRSTIDSYEAIDGSTWLAIQWGSAWIHCPTEFTPKAWTRRPKAETIRGLPESDRVRSGKIGSLAAH